jgi:hypothetical protein
VYVFPTFDCVDVATAARAGPTAESRRVGQAVMELQLLAARANRPINTTDNARLIKDCATEPAEMREALRPANLYVYLVPFTPTPQQLAGRLANQVCKGDDSVRYCALP